jgi:thiol-disulfide isomerase/thioredoxin
MTRVRLIVVALTVAVAVGCSTHTVITPGPGGGPTHAQLVAAARLRPCPQSSAGAVVGGLPDVTLPCLGHGPAVHLAGLAGHLQVVNLWGSWCEPCQAEEKYLSAAYLALHRKVQFLGIDTVDDADSALDFDAHVSPPVRFPSVSDPDRKVLTALHFPGPPETLFLDRSGRIVHTNRVPYTSTRQVEADISTYLHVAA